MVAEASRDRREPFLNLTVVLVQKNSMYHMKFDLSPISPILKLKEDLGKIWRIPADRQKWMLRRVEVEDRCNLNDYNVVESDVIEVHVSRHL